MGDLNGVGVMRRAAELLRDPCLCNWDAGVAASLADLLDDRADRGGRDPWTVAVAAALLSSFGVQVPADAGRHSGWVRRRQAGHVCFPPEHETSRGEAAGRIGDLWRCGCGKLWRVGPACQVCDSMGPRPHLGTHVVGQGWWPARWWQRMARGLRSVA